LLTQVKGRREEKKIDNP